MMSETEAYNPFSNGRIPAEIAENLKEFCPDGNHEEFLIQQESVYMYLQANGKRKAATSDYGQTSNPHQFSEQEGEHSCLDAGSQVALDEAIARSLQLGEEFESFCVFDHNESEESTSGTTPARVTNQHIRQDDVDPDNMTYEELQSLGEAVGHENKGLSEDIISRLPTTKYKASGLFSKKKKKEECVICFAEYRNRDQLTLLPCTHQYHSECITRWLKERKHCPLCKEEVRDE